MYFDQRTGALHAICWSKSFVSALKHIFCLFPSLKGKKKKRKESAKNNKKNILKCPSSVSQCNHQNFHFIKLQPVNTLRSTHSLFEIYNKCLSKKSKENIYKFWNAKLDKIWPPPCPSVMPLCTNPYPLAKCPPFGKLKCVCKIISNVHHWLQFFVTVSLVE